MLLFIASISTSYSLELLLDKFFCEDDAFGNLEVIVLLS